MVNVGVQKLSQSYRNRQIVAQQVERDRGVFVVRATVELSQVSGQLHFSGYGMTPVQAWQNAVAKARVKLDNLERR